MDRLKVLLAYLGVGVAGMAMAFLVTSHWVTPTHSQEDMPPPIIEGDIPEEGIPQTAPPAARVVTPQRSIEDFTFLEPFVYDTQEGRRDPFKPTSSGKKGSGVFNDESVLLPLQRFDLEDIVLVGIMWDVRNPKAMFLDPNGVMHVIGVDERIGRNKGYIAVIREGEVVVVEAQRLRGELIYTTRLLRITTK